MARLAENHPLEDPAIVVANLENEATPETFTAWLDQLQSSEPLKLSVTAAQTLTEIRAAGD